LNPRTKNLRTSLLNLEHSKYRDTKKLSLHDKGDFSEESLIVRKALALGLLLKESNAVIMNDELIVGQRTLYSKKTGDRNVFGTNYVLPVKPATEHLKIYYPSYFTDEEANYANLNGIREGLSTSHVPFGTEKVLRLGIGGLLKEARLKLEINKNTSPVDFLEAVIITLEAASEFILDHSHEAEAQASLTTSLERRGELRNIAEICRWVSVNPPRGFHEALQLFWFFSIVTSCENQSCIPLGRFDQDLYPYLKKDLDKGVITREEALELLECLWIKLNTEDDLTTDTCINITLSGQTKDGLDATNDLTYLCLDASKGLRLTDPKINVRFYRNSPDKLWEECCQMVKMGMGGFPAFYNDEAVIEGLLRMNIPLEEARLYSCDGCQEIIIPGKGDFYPVFTSVNLLEAVNLTLGASPNIDTAKEVEAIDYASFEDFMNAYFFTLKKMVEDTVQEGNIRDCLIGTLSPVPFLSCTLEGCIENIKDKTWGGATYNFTGCNGQSFASAVNSLTSIKKIVFDEELVSLDELRNILKSNWDGNERLRQYTLNRVPKFGNNDDYVDKIAVEVADAFIEEVLGYFNPRGGPYYPGLFTFHHVSKGLSLNASPDGRKAGDSVSTHLTPVAGTDTNGPTNVVNSAVKVTKLHPPEGTALDLRFHPSALESEEGLSNLKSFIEGFMGDGGNVIQFNVVDQETLREAQRDPESYRSLVVRVWGFSAYFVTLTKEYQDEIIARTAHGL
jgi:formate C-acetyltransferase